ncbi:hypothetical protein GF326_07770 [Candidatus Bathyarchaeota archaeon]|nr:hypothetical protein [Candidatus Bathyarchaeota archaeon]
MVETQTPFQRFEKQAKKTIDKIRTSTKKLIEKMQNKGTDESEEDPIIHESEEKQTKWPMCNKT